MVNFNNEDYWKKLETSQESPGWKRKVAIVGEEGDELPPGNIGQIAVQRKDRWERVADKAYMDSDGYFWYVGRTDDVIISSGYTIGPVEVEQAIMKHPYIPKSVLLLALQTR